MRHRGDVSSTAGMDARTLTRRGLLLGGPSAVAGLALAGCGLPAGPDAAQGAQDIDYGDWDAVLAAARGQEVSWYGYGGNDSRNAWLQDTLAPRLQEAYGIRLNVVGMDINDILTQLSGEMQAGSSSSAIAFGEYARGEQETCHELRRDRAGERERATGEWARDGEGKRPRCREAGMVRAELLP